MRSARRQSHERNIGSRLAINGQEMKIKILVVSLFLSASLLHQAIAASASDDGANNHKAADIGVSYDGHIDGADHFTDTTANLDGAGQGLSGNDISSGSGGRGGGGGGGGIPKVPAPKGNPPSANNGKKTVCGVNNTMPVTKHPVIIATGEKVKDETDFAGMGLYPLGLSRHYHGFGTQISSMFGNNWTSSYDYHLYSYGCDHDTTGDYPQNVCIPQTFELDTPDGNFVYTRVSNYIYKVVGSDIMGRIIWNGPGSTYDFTVGDNAYSFDASGKITSLYQVTSGNGATFTYNGNNLASVTSVGNQSINFTWSGTHLSQVKDPRGQVWAYGYTAGGMLQTVTSPDSHVTTYGYDAAHPSWLNAITVDSIKILAVTYFTNGKVSTSGTPDGEATESFTYGTNSTTVTNQLGDATTFGYQTVQGGLKLASVSHQGTATCPAMSATTVYDTNGWVDYTLDWRGIKTDYTYAVDGRLTDMTLAAGTATPLKDVYTWTTVTGRNVLQSDAAYDTSGNLIRTTTYGYAPSGYPASVSVKDQVTGAIASVSYSYTIANNILQSRSETRNLPAGAATTTYNYDGSGNVINVTDPSGVTVSFSSYDGLGRPGAMIAANGVSHTFTYDGRGNLATDTAYLANGNTVTRYIYDGRNHLVWISLPDGSSHNFTIAQSGRISAQTDVAGNAATETFTNASTIIESKGRAVAAVAGSSVSSSISGSVSSTVKLDSLGRSLNTLGNNGQHVSYGYDANGNVTSASDSLHTTTNAYDALNRLAQTTLPDSSTIMYGYAPNGTLNSVLTSRGAQTTYTTNGFGSVTQRTSPDTGLTTYTVDPFGRVTQEVRANGTTVAYGYDGLDRLASRTSNGNTETYSYASSGVNATRLTGITNPTESSTFGYEGHGNVSSQTDVILGQSFSTSYSYNAAGQLASMTYPDGLSVTYSYNGAGQATGATPSRSGGAVASAVYQPFSGTPYALAFGNGSTMMGAVDTDGRLTSLNSVFAKIISYNTDNTIYGINDSAYPDLNETFSYNAQSRLTGTTRSADSQSFAIDSDGNRTSLTRAGATISYPVASAGNKVTSWTYMGGDIYSDGVRTYSRDEFDRLAVTTKSGQTVGQYRYDALDRRVYKSTSQGATYFVYASSGQLLYEQSAQRAVNYVWLAGRLVGISVNHGALQSVHTDWLGRPELVTGTTSPTVAWRASNTVYDRKVTLDTIGGLNVFFPGQYYDSETNLYYNWHRYYDANSGRYIQSDPIGLTGGINSYAYTTGNPISRVDPTGFRNIVGQFGGSNVQGVGVEGFVGFYVTVPAKGTNFDVGVYSAGGVGFGFNVGVGYSGGIVQGDVSDIRGITGNLNGGMTPLGGTVVFDGNGKVVGGTIGPADQAGLSLTYAETHAFSFGELGSWLGGVAFDLFHKTSCP